MCGAGGCQEQHRAQRWQSQTRDPRLDRAAGNKEGGWARRSWAVMPSPREWRAAGRSLPFPQRTCPPCYLMRELSVTEGKTVHRTAPGSRKLTHQPETGGGGLGGAGN